MIKKFISLNSLFLIICTTVIFSSTNENLEIAFFAGGCFWCMESDFEKIPGVKKVVSGYTGGKTRNPNYNSYAEAGHLEVVQIFFKPSLISYSKLLEIFWTNIDPMDKNGQFCDRGYEYSSAIFFVTTEQKLLAEISKNNLENSGIFGNSIQTQISKAKDFFPAEDYHQDYYKKSPLKYKYYRFRCGRDRKLTEIWGENFKKFKLYKNASLYKKPNKQEILQRLTPLQFEVTQKDGTEPPFKNKYWNNNREGIYVDIVSGEPLFSSTDKYKSGTGWPSFTKPITGAKIIKKEDKSWFYIRTELRSKYGDSHLGHLFNDGPMPGGLRYCINSAALRFIPTKNLAKEGYFIYKDLFKK